MKAPLKAGAWWNYKIPPLLAVAYFALAAGARPPDLANAIWSLALYMLAAIGIAGFGHLFTDAFDVAEDRTLGKPNLWAPLGPGARTALLVTLLAASWLPWLGLPVGRIGFMLIGLQFVMFALYAMPPIRLKERGFWGIIADAIYAHMLPALITWYPFSILAHSLAPDWFPTLLGAWALTVGIRHLLQHQASQLESDLSANVRTYAVRNGRDATLALIARILPLEMVAFIVLLGVIGQRQPIVAAGFGAYLIWQVVKLRTTSLSSFDLRGAHSDADRPVAIGKIVLSGFYERWLAPFILAGLSIAEPSYLVLLIIHLILFRRAFVGMMSDDVPRVVRHFRSRHAVGT